jgi:hypothetical protein
MTRQQLEHIIRAAAANANVRDVVVIGSQAILGTFPDAPPELTQSMEADVYPKDDPKGSDVIDGVMGEMSLFHDTFGYFAHGVGEETAVVPEGWRDRLVKVEAQGAVGWCLEPHDLAVSKLAAARPNDLAFVEAMVRRKMVSPNLIRERIEKTPGMSREARELALARLSR